MREECFRISLGIFQVSLNRRWRKQELKFQRRSLVQMQTVQQCWAERCNTTAISCKYGRMQSHFVTVSSCYFNPAPWRQCNERSVATQQCPAEPLVALPCRTIPPDVDRLLGVSGRQGHGKWDYSSNRQLLKRWGKGWGWSRGVNVQHLSALCCTIHRRTGIAIRLLAVRNPHNVCLNYPSYVQLHITDLTTPSFPPNRKHNAFAITNENGLILVTFTFIVVPYSLVKMYRRFRVTWCFGIMR